MHESGCTFSVEGDMFVKHLQWDIADDWFSTYKKLREFEPISRSVWIHRQKNIYAAYSW